MWNTVKAKWKRQPGRFLAWLVPVDQIGFQGGSRTGLEGGRIEDYLYWMQPHPEQELTHLCLCTCRGSLWLGSIP